MSRTKFTAVLVVIAATFLALFASTATASAATNTTAAATATATFHGITITVKSDNGATPQIREASCVGRPNWFHLYTIDGDTCFGFTGTAYLAYNDTYNWCWGNNYGYLNYVYPDPDGYYDVTSITIQGWSGNGSCPV